MDVTFDLQQQVYKPFNKPNNTIQYVQVQSDHPPHAIKNIPKGVNTRLSMLSANENIFNEAAVPYQEALDKSGYVFKLTYNPPPAPKQNKNRKRNILWYNPPHSKIIKTNIGKKFFEILDKCFPKQSIVKHI